MTEVSEDQSAPLECFLKAASSSAIPEAHCRLDGVGDAGFCFVGGAWAGSRFIWCWCCVVAEACAHRLHSSGLNSKRCSVQGFEDISSHKFVQVRELPHCTGRASFGQGPTRSTL